MKFRLQPRMLSPPAAMEIDEAEYRLLRSSRPILIAAFELEENFDLLIGNYLELEKSALSITADAMVRRRHGYEDLFELRAETNRRAINFLNTARLLLDQMMQKVKRCGGDSTDIKALLSAYYGNQFEYRFMEALRNHAQHSGSAIHSLGVNTQWLPPKERLRDEHSICLLTSREYLADDPAFNRRVLKESPEDVDFLTAVRKYMECLGNVQEIVRRRLAPQVDAAREAFASAISRYELFSKASSLGLAACPHKASAQDPVVPIFLNWDDVRLRLSLRNSSFTNLSLRYVTSRAHGI